MLLQAALGQLLVQAPPEVGSQQPPLCRDPPAGVDASAQRVAHVLLAHSFKRQALACMLVDPDLHVRHHNAHMLAQCGRGDGACMHGL